MQTVNIDDRDVTEAQYLQQKPDQSKIFTAKQSFDFQKIDSHWLSDISV